MVAYDKYYGYKEDGYDYWGLDRNGYDRQGYNRNGYNIHGFNRQGINKNGTRYDDRGYDKDGFDRDGFNANGIDREGYDKDGFNSEGYNRKGYGRDGYNKEGYDIQGYDRIGYNKEGFDREGYDKDGYNVRGFDENGFDMQGYNIKGEFNEYIDSYLNENKDIKKQITDEIYTVDYKDIMLDINTTMKLIGQDIYKSASNCLRTASEGLVDIIIMKDNVTPKIKNGTLASKLQYIKEKMLLNNDDLEIMYSIKEIGNKGSHPGETTTKEENELLLNEFKKVFKNWINKVS